MSIGFQVVHTTVTVFLLVVQARQDTLRCSMPFLEKGTHTQTVAAAMAGSSGALAQAANGSAGIFFTVSG